MLWFDVEERYNTTQTQRNNSLAWLWFDVEERYNTTVARRSAQNYGCCLM